MRTDILNGLIALKIVAEKGNFTAAAKEMGVSPSAISQTIKQLEKTMGSILVNRTTRSTSLTDLGEQFLLQYKPGLEQVLSAVDQLDSFSGKPIGTLRINLPRAAWNIMVNKNLNNFQKQYPEIVLELVFEEKRIDIVNEGFDAGIRPSEVTAKDMTAIMISPPFRYVTAASPTYLKKHGVPKHPKDLLNHQCITYKTYEGYHHRKWDFEENNRDFSIEVKGNITVNESLIAVELGINNLGMIYATDDSLKQAISRGDLFLVLEEFAPRSDGYYLYYPSVSQVSPKLRAFIDYLKAQRNL